MTGLLLTLLLAATPGPNRCEVVRSKSAVEQFKKATPCPETCATFVKRNGKYHIYEKCGACNVDHVCPLACCGEDKPSNMQWLDAKENKSKGADCSFCKKQ